MITLEGKLGSSFDPPGQRRPRRPGGRGAKASGIGREIDRGEQRRRCARRGEEHGLGRRAGLAKDMVSGAGALSADHVLNVLARLRDTPIIESVETTLRLQEEPVADTRRYDQLHGQAVSHV